MPNVPSGEKRMLLLLLVTVALVGGYYLVYKPLKNGDDNLSTEELLTEELLAARSRITNLPVIKKENQILKDDARNADFYFFDSLDQINKHTQNLVKEMSSELKLNLSKPKTSRKNPGSYVFTVSGRGNYFAVLTLLRKIEESWPQLGITDFAISRRNPSRRVDPKVYLDNPGGGIKMPNPQMNVRVVFTAQLKNVKTKKKRSRR